MTKHGFLMLDALTTVDKATQAVVAGSVRTLRRLGCESFPQPPLGCWALTSQRIARWTNGSTGGGFRAGRAAGAPGLG